MILHKHLWWTYKNFKTKK